MAALKPAYQTHHARKDPPDARDQQFAPKGDTCPREVPLDRYLQYGVPVIDQGKEHVCTGVALAAAADYLFLKHHPDKELNPVSGRMLYEMARRYDGVPDPNHQGSTARGAVKGWHKTGVCADALWPYHAFDTDHDPTPARLADAALRPLRAYHRVDGNKIADLRAAIAEIGVVYVTAHVHEGWHQVGPDGRIPYPNPQTSSHAFVLVGYDQGGFWVHNSKGTDWGKGGFGWLSVEDWLANKMDAWSVEIVTKSI